MRQMNYKQDLANRITESVLKEMGLKHSSRRRALKENREQEILDKVHSMRSNIFDLTEEGYGVLYIDYDPQTNELYAGGATNAGIIKEYSVDYDDSQSLDYNLEGLYDEILQSPPTDDTMAENKKRIRKIDRIVKESVKRVIKESLNSYVFHCYIPGLGNESMLIDNISDAFPYINKAEYWDITKGSNSSEPSNLVAWGGESGYWSNIMNDPETNTRLKELILSKKKN